MADNEPLDESKVGRSTSRKPFTSLSQVDADLALARALQQQEEAYSYLQMGIDGSEYGTSGSGIVDYEYMINEGIEAVNHRQSLAQECSEDEDAEEEHVEGSHYENDEAFARALQDAEQRDATTYMMGLIGVEGSDGEEAEDSYGNQEVWDVDPDTMFYEELVALGEAVGTHSKGLEPDVIAALPFSKFVSLSTSSEDPCAICRFEYEDEDTLSTLPCKHQYHTDCIKNWLQINKVCPLCGTEVKS